MANDNDEKDYTSKTLARAAGLNDSRVRQLLAAGEIPEAYKNKLFGYWVIPKEAGDRWLKERRKP